MSIEESYNFRRIDDRITTSGLVSRTQLAGLQAEGYDAVVNLLPESNDRAVPDEERIVREQGLDYVYIPVDFDAPTQSDLDAFTDAMDAHAGQKVHVHCAANYRVSAFYALYARQRGLCDDDEATALIRDIWDPADFPAWDALISEARSRKEGAP
jgi:protein tyrosine phosphatase (PTP) superfamily phosphohydrolase (DUF442 family)